MKGGVRARYSCVGCAYGTWGRKAPLWLESTLRQGEDVPSLMVADEELMPKDEGVGKKELAKISQSPEHLASSDKGLFLTQTSLECLYLGGTEREMSSVEGQPTT